MFSSFMVHSTFTMMEKVVFSGLPAAICLLTMMFLFGTTPFGAYSTPNAKVKPILTGWQLLTLMSVKFLRRFFGDWYLQQFLSIVSV